jgi:hypothetical protein
VDDTGIGIPSDELPRLFDRFYQVDGSQTNGHEGTGIGLAVTKELVELHKGKISVVSEPGRGSTFTVTLPTIVPAIDGRAGIDARGDSDDRLVEQARPLDDEPSSMEPEHIGESRALILVVEDSDDMRGYIRTRLEKEYRVIESANGCEGGLKAVESIPDLIISDVMMPAMDGRKNQPHTDYSSHCEGGRREQG